MYREEADGGERRFPPISYFAPENRSVAERSELETWHREEAARFEADPSLEYDIVAEMIRYCRLDVECLRLAMGKYTSYWRTIYGHDPLVTSITSTSFFNFIFRRFYLPPRTISLLPPNGFSTGNRKSSKIAEAWISYMQHIRLRLKGVRTARKMGEIRFCGRYVDGYGRSEGEDGTSTQHVLQMHGCL